VHFLFKRGLVSCALIVLVSCLSYAASADVVYERLKSFGFPDQLGHMPLAGLTKGPGGVLYGTTSAGGLISGGAGVVYAINENDTEYRVLHRFAEGGTNAFSPRAELLLASDGALYGTARLGPSQNAGGSVFKLNTDGTGFKELHCFRGGTNDGAAPYSKLIQGSDGALYGTTYVGGTPSQLLSVGGTVFRLSTDGSQYAILHRFFGGEDGASPVAGLVGGSNGRLYGVTSSGGSTNRTQHGTIYGVNQDGSGYAVLHRFNGTNGTRPSGDLIRTAGGVLFGTTISGGASNRGVIFRINEDGSAFSVVRDFTGSVTDGGTPTAGLTLSADGFLYGTTTTGGTNKGGVIFRLRSDGSEYTVLAQLPPGGMVNEDEVSPLVFGNNGFLYATKSAGGLEGLGYIFKLNPDGGPLEIVRSFRRYGGDARGGEAKLLRASDGLFYGTAAGGGSNNAGAVFRFAENPFNYALVHSFTTDDGAGPGTLIEALPGVLFGAMSSGGQSNKGTIFRLNTDGSDFAVLHDFAGADEGHRPLAGLMLARNGMLYGTTIWGGANSLGSIFRLNPDGSDFQTIHSLCCGVYSPGLGPLVQGDDDTLYGTAQGGQFGRGVLFRIGTNGLGFQVLHHFPDDGSEGAGFPWAGLIIGPDRRLYGSTAPGSSGFGALFAINQDGTQFTVLHTFNNGDGSNPLGQLLVGHDGAFYGTTQFGGTFGGQGGVIFRMNTDGSAFSVLHSFAFPVGPEGARPTSGLVEGSDHDLYGVTPLGGEFSGGVILRVSPGVSTNYAPALVTPVSDQQIWMLDQFIYTLPAGMFSDRDWGQTLTYSAGGLPGGVNFNPVTRVFNGVPNAAGTYNITVTATDNGAPVLNASDSFLLRVLLPDLAIAKHGNNISLNWPDQACCRYEIQESADLVAWTSLGLPGGITIGSRRYATLQYRPGQWFYRLAQRF
jgi:uncharacterized repeat protein (TIGR03803 family)